MATNLNIFFSQIKKLLQTCLLEVVGEVYPFVPCFPPTQRSPIFIKIGQLGKKRKTEARSDHIERFDPNSPHKAQGAQVLPLPQSEGEFSPANILLCGGLHCYSPCPEIQWCPSCLACPVRVSV